MFKPPLTYEDGRIIREIANFQARRAGGKCRRAKPRPRAVGDGDFLQRMAAGGRADSPLR